jgi:hypothetical protein
VPAVTLTVAARELEKSPATLRRWIAAGAPTVRLGEAGRSKGSLVIVSDLIAWRAAQEGIKVSAAHDLDAIARGLLEAYSRGNGGNSDPVWRELGVPSGRAAVVLAEAYVSIVRALAGREPQEYPAAIETLHKCAVLPNCKYTAGFIFQP